jgi:phage gpG-like protein
MPAGPKNQRDNQLIIERLRENIAKNAPDNDVVKTGLLRIAMLISSKAKLNIRKQRPPILDTGRLINSISWEFKKEGNVNTISVGSFGVIYAAMNEFGGPISEKQRRAMFYAMSQRRVKRPPRFPKVIESKNGQLVWRPRPYLAPAVAQSKEEIIKIITSLVGTK